MNSVEPADSDQTVPKDRCALSFIQNFGNVPDAFFNFFFISTERCLYVQPFQLDAPSDWRPGGRGFNPRRGRQHSFVEIDHEIFSTVVLSLPLIQEGQLSVSGERMCTILVNHLED